MKTLLLLVPLVLCGCYNYIDKPELDKADNLCKSHNGVYNLRIGCNITVQGDKINIK